MDLNAINTIYFGIININAQFQWRLWYNYYETKKPTSVYRRSSWRFYFDGRVARVYWQKLEDRWLTRAIDRWPRQLEQLLNTDALYEKKQRGHLLNKWSFRHISIIFYVCSILYYVLYLHRIPNPKRKIIF